MTNSSESDNEKNTSKKKKTKAKKPKKQALPAGMNIINKDFVVSIPISLPSALLR